MANLHMDEGQKLLFRLVYAATMKMLFMLLVVCSCLDVLARAQDASGFISIDCGAEQNYNDLNFSIPYVTDVGFVETGQNMNVSEAYMNQVSLLQQLTNMRIFPNGTRNCYTIRPEQESNSRYLIRASFAYGNYDNKSQSPMFDLYIDVNYWTYVNSSDYTYEEIIYTTSRDYIQVCLVNTGYGTPFISALELRALDNSVYNVTSGALRTWWRANIGSNATYRHPQDDYDRIWGGQVFKSGWYGLNATGNVSETIKINNDAYKVPPEVLMTAQQSSNSSYGLVLGWPSDPANKWYLYAHFNELRQNKSRQIQVYMVDQLITTFKPEYLKPVTVASHLISAAPMNFSIFSTSESKDPPFVNAIEIFHALDLPSSLTDLDDVNDIVDIKKTYQIIRETWQGDPCLLKNFTWDGLECKQDNIPRIFSLNLSSSGLNGTISLSFSNLTALVSLDLSSNELSGELPEFFTQMLNLKFLNLSRNNLNGSIPEDLKKKMADGTLQLSLDGNPLCQTDSCTLSSNPPPPVGNETKKKRFLIIVLVAVAAAILGIIFICIVATIFMRIKKKQTVSGTRSIEVITTNEDAGSKDRDETSDREVVTHKNNKSFTASDISTITENFKIMLGEGTYGKVYHGTLRDGTKVAVKMLPQSSKQHPEEFRAEAQKLMSIHHKSLVSLIGYCDEPGRMALVYEFMYSGNLEQLLSEHSVNVLSWSQRIHIAIDAAEGLEHLHSFGNPPIVHRDLKTPNILLNENLQAKISDFGASSLSIDYHESVKSTRPVGTPGYLDPVFHSSCNINKKSDVYSFGIVLFKLITGRPAIIRTPRSSTHIMQWVTPLIESRSISSIIDPRLHGQFSEDSVWKAIETAMKCAQLVPMQRPDMNHVLSYLHQCLTIETEARRDQSAQGSRVESTFEITSPRDENPIAR